MPYKMYRQGKKFCVRNSDTGESKGCSSSRDTAIKHMRALYAAEGGAKMGKKELDDLVTQSLEPSVFDYYDEKEVDEDNDSLEKSGYVPYGVTDFDALDDARDAQMKTEELIGLASDFVGLANNVIFDPEIEDKGTAIVSLATQFADRLSDEADDEGQDDDMDKETTDETDQTPVDQEDKAISKREDVSPADKKRAVAEYGRVTYADPKNKKYPLDSEKHIRAAWSYFGMPKNYKKYSPGERSAIRSRIVKAWKAKIDKKGPPAVSQKSLVGQVIDKVKSIFDKPTQPDSIMLWKETQDGPYSFLLCYSNNFRDNDNPPEIISEASHRYFVDQVDKGLVPPPELWIWHVSEWKVGTASAVAYDDSGFALAFGTIDKDKGELAEWLAQNTNNFKLSHGMPFVSIERDTDDPTIIVQHTTKEISFLPDWAAANSLTNFVIMDTKGIDSGSDITEDEKAMIPEEKKKILVDQYGVKPELLEQLESANSTKATQAVEEGLERKDNLDATAAVAEATQATDAAQATQAVAETPAPEEEQTEAVDQAQYPTREEVAEAFGSVLSEMKNQIGILAETVGSLAKEITALKESDDAKITKAVSGVPAASLTALLTRSIVGSSRAEVGIQDKQLSDSKPAENLSAEKDGDGLGTGIPFIDRMLTPPTK